MLDRYPGSKGAEGVWQRIISEMPPHKTYIEAFLGSGVVLRRKRPAATTIGVDVDPAVYDAWHSSAMSDELTRLTASCTLGLVQGDARKWLPRYFERKHVSTSALVYADPPYLLETRSSQRMLYDHELVTDQEHLELLRVLKKIPAMMMISGYWSELYDRELTGWRTVQMPTIKRNGERAVEWLWCNFPEPVQLHDYRYLGTGYRERERIKKKMRRWTAKLRAMPGVERSALFWAMNRLNDIAPPETV